MKLRSPLHLGVVTIEKRHSSHAQLRPPTLLTLHAIQGFTFSFFLLLNWLPREPSLPINRDSGKEIYFGTSDFSVKRSRNVPFCVYLKEQNFCR